MRVADETAHVDDRPMSTPTLAAALRQFREHSRTSVYDTTSAGRRQWNEDAAAYVNEHATVGAPVTAADVAAHLAAPTQRSARANDVCTHVNDCIANAAASGEHRCAVFVDGADAEDVVATLRHTYTGHEGRARVAAVARVRSVEEQRRTRRRRGARDALDAAGDASVSYVVTFDWSHVAGADVDMPASASLVSLPAPSTPLAERYFVFWGRRWDSCELMLLGWASVAVLVLAILCVVSSSGRFFTMNATWRSAVCMLDANVNDTCYYFAVHEVVNDTTTQELCAIPAAVAFNSAIRSSSSCNALDAFNTMALREWHDRVGGAHVPCAIPEHGVTDVGCVGEPAFFALDHETQLTYVDESADVAAATTKRIVEKRRSTFMLVLLGIGACVLLPGLLFALRVRFWRDRDSKKIVRA